MAVRGFLYPSQSKDFFVTEWRTAPEPPRSLEIGQFGSHRRPGVAISAYTRGDRAGVYVCLCHAIRHPPLAGYGTSRFAQGAGVFSRLVCLLGRTKFRAGLHFWMARSRQKLSGRGACHWQGILDAERKNRRCRLRWCAGHSHDVFWHSIGDIAGSPVSRALVYSVAGHHGQIHAQELVWERVGGMLCGWQSDSALRKGSPGSSQHVRASRVMNALVLSRILRAGLGTLAAVGVMAAVVLTCGAIRDHRRMADRHGLAKCGLLAAGACMSGVASIFFVGGVVLLNRMANHCREGSSSRG